VAYVTLISSAVMLDSISLAKNTGRVSGKEDSGSNVNVCGQYPRETINSINWFFQTKTSPIIYTRDDMFYMASNVSSFVTVNWFFDIPFNDSGHRHSPKKSQQRLGNNLLSLQAGIEPVTCSLKCPRILQVPPTWRTPRHGRAHSATNLSQ